MNQMPSITTWFLFAEFLAEDEMILCSLIIKIFFLQINTPGYLDGQCYEVQCVAGEIHVRVNEEAPWLKCPSNSAVQVIFNNRDAWISDPAYGIGPDTAICRIFGIRQLKSTRSGYLTVFKI